MRGWLRPVGVAVLLGIILTAVLACSPRPGRGPIWRDDPQAIGRLRVLAAASLTESFTELGAMFEQENLGVKVEFSFSGSQTLRSQLEQGLQADVFASADQRQMDLAAAGLLTNSPANFASNQLVVVVPSASVAGAVRVQQLPDLAQPGVKVVLASPEVPAGGYARTTLAKMAAAGGEFGPDFAVKVLANVVSQETSVRQVAQKVALGEADAGVVYQTDAQAPDVAGRVEMIDIPKAMNVVATYPIATLRSSTQPTLAQAFVGLVLSPQGRLILAGHGFGPP
jgi:molybdate transport system substrate-binding protein